MLTFACKSKFTAENALLLIRKPAPVEAKPTPNPVVIPDMKAALLASLKEFPFASSVIKVIHPTTSPATPPATIRLKKFSIRINKYNRII